MRWSCDAALTGAVAQLGVVRSMPLVICLYCGREISTAAPACPHCGRPAQLPRPASRPPLPPPLPRTVAAKPKFFARIPRTVLAILATGFFGFVFCAFFGKDQMTGDPLANSLQNGFAGGVGGSLVAAYVAAIVISGLKGKPFFVVMGVLTLGMPTFSLLPVIGAIRIAKPNSTLARKYYDEQKLQIAHARFKKKLSASRRDRI